MLGSMWQGRGKANARGYLRARDNYFRKGGMALRRKGKKHRMMAAGIHKAFGGGWVS